MTDDAAPSRVDELAEYFDVGYENAGALELCALFGCDKAYLEAEPEPPAAAVIALTRMGEALSDRDASEARRFAAYLAHATDD